MDAAHDLEESGQREFHGAFFVVLVRLVEQSEEHAVLVLFLGRKNGFRGCLDFLFKPEQRGKQLRLLTMRDCCLFCHLWRLLLLLLHYFPGAPRDVVHVTQRVDDEQQVHGRYGQIVDQTARKTPELLRVEESGNNETRRRHDEENARR